MSLQLICFDLDDTFWEITAVIDAAEAELHSWLAAQAPALSDDLPGSLERLRAQVIEQQPDLRHRISLLRHRVLITALQQAGFDPHRAQQLADAGFEVFIEARHRVQLFPEVEDTLTALGQDYHLAVLTNGNADVRRLGLGHHFDVILRAEDIGIAKPDPAPFNEVLKRAGVDASEAVHIGDHPVDDISGAQGAGLKAVWFNPTGKAWSGQGQPDAEISNLAQLPELLRTWR